MASSLFFVTHPEVVVAPTTPVTGWALSQAGRRRMLAFVSSGALAEAGSVKSRLVSATIYITDMAQKSAMNAVWLDWVDRANPPQRACIGASLEEGDMIEIVAVAATKE